MEHTYAGAGKFFPVERTNIAVQALWIGGFTLLTAIGAQIEIPHEPIPYTLQTFFVLLGGALLGKRNGSLSQMLYLAIGAMGAPVFSHGAFGILRIVGPTGGYLLGFPVAAFAVGYLLGKGSSFLWTAVSMFAGLLIIFSLGTLWLNFAFYHDWTLSFSNGFLIFSWWDGVKLFTAAAIAHRLRASFSTK